MKQPKRIYRAPDTGKEYPLHEAPYDYAINCYRSDLRKAQTGSSDQCIIALGAKHDKLVEAAFVGAGRDAYICFKATPLRPAYALHFTVNARAQRVRDYFDTHKIVATKQIILSAPSAGRTLAHRAKLDGERREKIKNGDHVPTKRTTPRQDRITRIGVKSRPRAVVEKNTVTMPATYQDKTT
jgi:hypothetical protein